MSFSNEWNKKYQENTHMSIWPWSDLISLVMQHKPKKEKFKVLELGCGAGANIPLFVSLDVYYYAVEGSEAIVKQLHQQYPQFKDNIRVGDFTKDIPGEEFDLIIDRSSLTCNSERAIVECLNYCNKQLISGGKFIGVDWFSTKHSDYRKGEEAEDSWTRNNFVDSGFAGTGRVHFSDKEHLLDLFKDFKMLKMFHKTLVQELPDNNWELASWNFVAEKL